MTVRVDGLKELALAVAKADAELDKFMREGLLAIAEQVAGRIRPPYSQYSQKGASGVKAKVTTPGNALAAQTLRKSRPLRQRKNFGPLMYQKAFAPAAKDGEGDAQAAADVLFTKIKEEWDG